uniref:Uncharacterized protein n=1 Tax=Phasianus colchicus TaxID=9054 RepID=A0A669QIL4_PHACC
MPLPSPALPWLLAACCLCALPRGSGFPQPLSRYRDGAELPKSQQLALCFSQWMELSNQPQVSCLWESQIAAAEFTKKVCSFGRKMTTFFFLAGVSCTWSTKASRSFPMINVDSPLLPATFSHLVPCENPLVQISACRSE